MTMSVFPEEGLVTLRSLDFPVNQAISPNDIVVSGYISLGNLASLFRCLHHPTGTIEPSFRLIRTFLSLGHKVTKVSAYLSDVRQCWTPRWSLENSPSCSGR